MDTGDTGTVDTGTGHTTIAGIPIVHTTVTGIAIPTIGRTTVVTGTGILIMVLTTVTATVIPIASTAVLASTSASASKVVVINLPGGPGTNSCAGSVQRGVSPVLGSHYAAVVAPKSLKSLTFLLDFIRRPKTEAT